MMDTILNLGLNDGDDGRARRPSGEPGLRRRLPTRGSRRCYRDIVGVDVVPEDPWAQLRGAVEAVFRSWNSDRARAYRAHEGISGRPRAPRVTVQAMVFGNRGDDSGTGRALHAQPGDRRARPVRRRDVQRPGRGRRRRHPPDGADRRPRRADAGGRRASCGEYATRWSATTRDLLRHRVHDRARASSGCSSVRVGKRSPQAALRIAVDMAEDAGLPALPGGCRPARGRPARESPDRDHRAWSTSAPPWPTGLPASPGVACGEIVDDARRPPWRRPRPAGPVILVRAETSPDDVHGMARAAGILTSTGGLASHAAVVARGWGIPAVVGAAGVEVRRRDRSRSASGPWRPARRSRSTAATGEVFAGAGRRRRRGRARGGDAARVGPRARDRDRRAGGDEPRQPRRRPARDRRAGGRGRRGGRGAHRRRRRCGPSSSRAMRRPRASPRRSCAPRTRRARSSTGSSPTAWRRSPAGSFRLTADGKAVGDGEDRRRHASAGAPTTPPPRSTRSSPSTSG